MVLLQLSNHVRMYHSPAELIACGLKLFVFMLPQSDEYYMQLALRQAQQAFDEGEVPIGAVIVLNNTIIAKGYNSVEKLNDPTAHAEMLALTTACHHLGAKYLPGAVIYITVEPCHMCAGALYWSKIARVVYGAGDVKNGYQRFCNHNPFHPKTIIEGGLAADEAAALMKLFFKQRR